VLLVNVPGAGSSTNRAPDGPGARSRDERRVRHPLAGSPLDGRSVRRPARLSVYPAVFGFALWNSGYRQGTTGQSLGKEVLGTKLVSAGTGAPIGFGPAFVRQIAHVIDGLPFYLGYFRPLWDARRQTFADSICDTVVVHAGS
jgi:uncharacterized RDD family membrane protein YckC